MHPPTYLILGATGGIGSALVRRLRAGGARVVAGGRSPERLDPLARETGAEPARVDAAEPETIREAVEQAASGGALVGACSCMGTLLLKPAHLTTPEDWDHTLQVNLTASFHLLRHAARRMGAGGSIAFVSSVAARTGLANHEGIAAAKAGLIGLALSAAATYAAKGIRVNCVAPGLVDTPLTARITGSPASLKASQELHPLGRIGTAEEVAGALAWLLSPEQGWITGQVLGVDGGMGSLRARPPAARPQG